MVCSYSAIENVISNVGLSSEMFRAALEYMPLHQWIKEHYKCNGFNPDEMPFDDVISYFLSKNDDTLQNLYLDSYKLFADLGHEAFRNNFYDAFTKDLNA